MAKDLGNLWTDMFLLYSEAPYRSREGFFNYFEGGYPHSFIKKWRPKKNNNLFLELKLKVGESTFLPTVLGAPRGF